MSSRGLGLQRGPGYFARERPHKIHERGILVGGFKEAQAISPGKDPPVSTCLLQYPELQRGPGYFARERVGSVVRW